MRLFFKYGFFVLAVAVLNMTLADLAQAETLNKRLQKVEKQLKAVQRKVFTPGSRFEQSSQTAQGPVQQGSVAIADMEARISQMETQLRQLTGQVEEGNYRIGEINKKIETLVRDYEFRLGELEKTAQGDTAIKGADIAPPGTSQKIVLPQGSEQEQYAFAQGLVSKGEYAGAEAALKVFLQRFPDSKLAGNAQYWLGQTYYIRKSYTESTRAFLEGYNSYPKSPKSAAFLLKIGMSLYAMGEKSDACDAYRELSLRFPKSVENIKRRPSEEKKAGCL